MDMQNSERVSAKEPAVCVCVCVCVHVRLDVWDSLRGYGGDDGSVKACLNWTENDRNYNVIVVGMCVNLIIW